MLEHQCNDLKIDLQEYNAKVSKLSDDVSSSCKFGHYIIKELTIFIRLTALKSLEYFLLRSIEVIVLVDNQGRPVVFGLA